MCAVDMYLVEIESINHMRGGDKKSNGGLFEIGFRVANERDQRRRERRKEVEGGGDR
jgi:hypothetical protein